ncbi:MAG: Hsp20/alpha crystallin family protein [Anaerolineae bacterium]|nr:Hsp20/alpha crystallin family protein [Anaerolineae bacterium]
MFSEDTQYKNAGQGTGKGVIVVDDSNHEQQVETAEVHYHVLKSGQQLLLVRHSHAWRPPTDVMVDDDLLTVVVEVAGMQAGEFHVTFTSQRLTISGVRSPKDQGHVAYHQFEIRYGEFCTEVTLPWIVDEDQIVAHYEDGFLKVELPRAEPHKINVVAADRDS